MFQKLKQSGRLSNIFLAVLFYVVAALVIYFIEEWMPSQMCNPGLGMLLFLLMPVVSSILFTRALIKDVSNDKVTFRGSTIIHFVFALAL
jgi:Na+/melibiose symporter-like transporter